MLQFFGLSFSRNLSLMLNFWHKYCFIWNHWQISFLWTPNLLKSMEVAAIGSEHIFQWLFLWIWLTLLKKLEYIVIYFDYLSFIYFFRRFDICYGTGRERGACWRLRLSQLSAIALSRFSNHSWTFVILFESR